MDAVYNATHIGGGQLHRLFDGSHTISGAWGKVHDALPDDNFAQEVWGFLTAYWKDLSTHVGMPVVGMSQESYQTITTTLSDTFHIPKPWFQGMLHANAVEFFGTAIATISLVLQWSKAETEEFSRLAGSLGIASLASSNPALAVVTLATLARAFMRAKGRDGYGDAVDRLAKGGFGTGVFLATSALIPGPVWVGILTGMCVAAIASKASSNVRISDLSGFVVRSVQENLPGQKVT